MSARAVIACAAAHELLGRSPDERGLPKPPWGEQDDVLPGEGVRLQLGELVLAVGERFVEGERAEPEWVERDVRRHDARLYIAA